MPIIWYSFPHAVTDFLATKSRILHRHPKWCTSYQQLASSLGTPPPRSTGRACSMRTTRSSSGRAATMKRKPSPRPQNLEHHLSFFRLRNNDPHPIPLRVLPDIALDPKRLPSPNAHHGTHVRRTSHQPPAFPTCVRSITNGFLPVLEAARLRGLARRGDGREAVLFHGLEHVPRWVHSERPGEAGLGGGGALCPRYPRPSSWLDRAGNITLHFLRVAAEKGAARRLNRSLRNPPPALPKVHRQRIHQS